MVFPGVAKQSRHFGQTDIVARGRLAHGCAILATPAGFTSRIKPAGAFSLMYSGAQPCATPSCGRAFHSPNGGHSPATLPQYSARSRSSPQPRKQRSTACPPLRPGIVATAARSAPQPPAPGQGGELLSRRDPRHPWIRRTFGGGPFRACCVRRMLSSAAAGSSSPEASMPASPPCCVAHANGLPSTSSTCTAASVTSGPMPSPGSSVARIIPARVRSTLKTFQER